MPAKGRLLELHSSQIEPGERPGVEKETVLLSLSLFNTDHLGMKHQMEGRLSELDYIISL